MKPALWPFILQGSDEENYRDVPFKEAMEDKVVCEVEGREKGESVSGKKVLSDMSEEGVEEVKDGMRGENEEEETKGGNGVVAGARRVSNGDVYKMCHRNPQYCGAENSCLWELKELSQHYHPSVQLFSKKLTMVTHLDYICTCTYIYSVYMKSFA